ncbi:unnamed protein product [Thelazia callipaeda]|uniref:Matrix protein n=1 Tax=Thelazia callipaeda TaxID=103827 RepID=A0A0N5D783_THECL|nr:unnamed protein product [Thelazia callipaeda]
MNSQMANYRRYPCFPTCRIPDKRDFMDSNPPRSNEDFYRHYDPWIGISTAIILSLFFVLIAFKTFVKWFLYQINNWRYYRRDQRETGCKNYKQNHTLYLDTTSSAVVNTEIADNGHISALASCCVER